MPFIVQHSAQQSRTLFYIFYGVTVHVGISTTIKKMAETLTSQGKKVLIFDALLGIKNFPITNKNQDKIPTFFSGLIPLSELITTHNGVDVISGMSTQNINALPLAQKNKIKNDLEQLATNYDIVLIDHPAQIMQSVFKGGDKVFWISPPNQKILLKTLQKMAENKNTELILTQTKNAIQRNNLHLLIKALMPECHIIEFFG